MGVDLRERARLVESEKITINLGYVDLGRVDVLVREGFYSNRTDLIRTAIRALVDRHDDTVQNAVTRSKLELGLRHYGRAELEAARDAGSPISIHIVGLASIAADVTPELAREAIASVEVLGTLQASAAIKSALRDRTR